MNVNTTMYTREKDLYYIFSFLNIRLDFSHPEEIKIFILLSIRMYLDFYWLTISNFQFMHINGYHIQIEILFETYQYDLSEFEHE